MSESKYNIKEILNKSHHIVDYVDVDDIVDKFFVKKLREDLNFSQSVFARILGVSKKTIEKWEQGVNPIKGCASRLILILQKDRKSIENIYKFTKVENKVDLYEYPANWTSMHQSAIKKYKETMVRAV